MKLVKARQWMEANFEKGSFPDIRSVKQHIKDGVLPGAMIGTRAYIDLDVWNDSIQPGYTPPAQLEMPEGFVLKKT